MHGQLTAVANRCLKMLMLPGKASHASTRSCHNPGPWQSTVVADGTSTFLKRRCFLAREGHECVDDDDALTVASAAMLAETCTSSQCRSRRACSRRKSSRQQRLLTSTEVWHKKRLQDGEYPDGQCLTAYHSHLLEVTQSILDLVQVVILCCCFLLDGSPVSLCKAWSRPSVPRPVHP